MINGALFESQNDEMVIVRDIDCFHCVSITCCPSSVRLMWHTSLLEGYWACRRLARVVDMFARRLQIQEDLTKQIADAIRAHHHAAGVAAGHLKAKHMCMMSVGVEKQNSVMTSSVMLGAFREVVRVASGVSAADRTNGLNQLK